MTHPPKTAASILMASMVLSLVFACPAMADVPMGPMYGVGFLALVVAGPLVIVLSVAAVVLIVRHLRKDKDGKGPTAADPSLRRTGRSEP